MIVLSFSAFFRFGYLSTYFRDADSWVYWKAYCPTHPSSKTQSGVHITRVGISRAESWEIPHLQARIRAFARYALGGFGEIGKMN